MANFLNTHDLPKLKPEDLNSLNRPRKGSKAEAVLKVLDQMIGLLPNFTKLPQI